MKNNLIKINCPHCNQKYEITSDCFDIKLKCESCGKNFIIKKPIKPTFKPFKAFKNEKSNFSYPSYMFNAFSYQVLAIISLLAGFGFYIFMDGKLFPLFILSIIYLVFQLISIVYICEWFDNVLKNLIIANNILSNF